MNRIIAFIFLILLLPAILVISILIKIKMPGPILFSQPRVGQHGKLFNVLKFRTMTLEHDNSSISIAGQSRITPLGRVLRKFKLDEIPQLWNIIRGEMVFVGPRPDVEGYADQLKGEDRKILKLKPGITGPASLEYANEEEILAQQNDPKKYNDEIIYPDKVRINLAYFYKKNLWLDLSVFFKSVFSVFNKKN